MANFLADNTPDDTDPINPYDQAPNRQPKVQNPYLTGASRWQNKRLSAHYTRRVGGASTSKWMKKMDALAQATAAEMSGRTGVQTAAQKQAVAIRLRSTRLAATPGIEAAAKAKVAAAKSQARKAKASSTAKATAAKSVKATRAARAVKARKAG